MNWIRTNQSYNLVEQLMNKIVVITFQAFWKKPSKNKTMSKKLTINEKIKILNKLLEPGLQLSCKTTYNVIADCNVITRLLELWVPSNRRCIRVNKKCQVTYDAMYECFSSMCEKNGDILRSESVTCGKAPDFTKMFVIVKLIASNRWFSTWKDRCGLSSSKIRQNNSYTF